MDNFGENLLVKCVQLEYKKKGYFLYTFHPALKQILLTQIFSYKMLINLSIFELHHLSTDTHDQQHIYI